MEVAVRQESLFCLVLWRSTCLRIGGIGGRFNRWRVALQRFAALRRRVSAARGSCRRPSVCTVGAGRVRRVGVARAGAAAGGGPSSPEPAGGLGRGRSTGSLRLTSGTSWAGLRKACVDVDEHIPCSFVPRGPGRARISGGAGRILPRRIGYSASCRTAVRGCAGVLARIRHARGKPLALPG